MIAFAQPAGADNTSFTDGVVGTAVDTLSKLEGRPAMVAVDGAGLGLAVMLNPRGLIQNNEVGNASV